MTLDPAPKPVYFQDVAVGDRFHMDKDQTGQWFEKVKQDGTVNAVRADGLKVYFFRLTEVWK